MKKNKLFTFVPLMIFLLETPFLMGQTTFAYQEPTDSPTPTIIEETATPTITPTQTPVPPTPTATRFPITGNTGVVIPLIYGQPTPAGVGPENHPPYINPLTGKFSLDLDILERRPVVVKITNYPRNVRPQSGLSRADIVYEYYMERGISRFIAIFYGENAEKVGPVRSGRLFDEHVFRMYDGVFVFGNADDRIMSYFLSLGRHIVNSFVLEAGKVSCTPDRKFILCRDRSIISYNNMFTDIEYMEGYIQRRNGNYRPNLSGMRFNERQPTAGSFGLNIYIRYSLFMYNKWTYDLKEGKYLHYQETIGYSDPRLESFSPHIDGLTDEHIAAENVVVIEVPHNFFVKTSGTEMINISLWGSGKGWAFRDGYMYPITWERPENGGIIQLFTPDGNPYTLKPGKTWYQVISQFSTAVAENGVDYRFIYSSPPEPDQPINPFADYPPFGPDYKP
jgi:hypothetical protein